MQGRMYLSAMISIQKNPAPVHFGAAVFLLQHFQWLVKTSVAYARLLMHV